MPLEYLYTSPHSHSLGAPDQSEQIAVWDNLTRAHRIGHNTFVTNPPAGYTFGGEARIHFGFDDGGGAASYRYVPGVKRIDTVWTQGTDVHYHPALVRLNLSDNSVHSVVDFTFANPQRADHDSATNYRNASNPDAPDTSANGNTTQNWDPTGEALPVTHRGSSTDSLAMTGRPAIARVADAGGDYFGFLFLGDWAFPMMGLSHEVLGVNLVTGATVSLKGWTSVSANNAGLAADTDPTDPPGGVGFDADEFTRTLYNVVGQLGTDRLVLQVEDQTFVREVISDFLGKRISKTFTKPDHVTADEPGHTPAWSFPSPAEGDGSFPDIWIRDALSSFGPGNTSLDTTFDDQAYTHSSTGGTFHNTAGTPRTTASAPQPGTAIVNPSAGLPPVTIESSPPDPRGFAVKSLALAQSIITERDGDLDTALAASRFVAYRLKESEVYFICCDPSDLSEQSRLSFTDDPVVTEDGYIVRGASTAVKENGAVSMLDLEEHEDFPGQYRPAERTAPSGYIGGGESDLRVRGYGQFAHYIVETGGGTRDEFSVRSLDAGNAYPASAPGGIHIEGPSGGPAPTTLNGFDPESVHLVTVFAAVPDGQSTAQRPLPHSGCKMLTPDADTMIFLPRDVTDFKHISHVSDGVSAWNAEVAALHKIVCYTRSGSTWSVAWTFDTFAHMGAIVEHEPSGRYDDRSGDCPANGVVTKTLLHTVLHGQRGQYWVKIRLSDGQLVGETKLSDLGGPNAINPVRTHVMDGVEISNRAPSGHTGAGFWVLKIS